MISLNRNVIAPEYFDQLSEEMQTVVADFLHMIAELKDSDSDYLRIEDELEEVECRSRSGFMPHSWNKGGLQLNAHANLSSFFFNGLQLKSKADKVVQQMIGISLKMAKEGFMEQFETELADLKIKAKDVSYHELYKLGHGDLAEKFSEYEDENLSSDQESTLHQIRIMYNGDGAWSVDVMHRISDAPYHRTCDDFKEFKFVANTVDELAKALSSIEIKVIAAYL